MKVLLASHEWEGVEPGGAQRAAAALAAGLAAASVDVTLAAAVRDNLKIPPNPPVPPAGVREVLVTSETDHDSFSWTQASYAQEWTDLLLDVRPDVVHLHHYFQLGVELPLMIRRLLPDAAIVMTLHEYFAICRLSGQMVDRQGHLCLASSPDACARCIEWPVSRTFARQEYLLRALAHVDAFLTPSEFARHRYVAWGLAPDRMWCVPNVLELDVIDVDAKRPPVDGRGLRLAYIGRLTPTKGFDVLVDAVPLALDRDAASIERVDVYGGPDRFDVPFQRRIGLMADHADSRVSFLGPYTQSDLPRILDSVDALVVPSVWWENSPVVIEEALARRVPIICSDIGGMAEKVRHGVDGWHFQVGNPAALADLLVDLAARGSWALPGMRRPESVADVTPCSNSNSVTMRVRSEAWWLTPSTIRRTSIWVWLWSRKGRL